MPGRYRKAVSEAISRAFRVLWPYREDTMTLRHEVAGLVSGVFSFGRGGSLQTLMFVRHDQLHPTRTAIRKRPQEFVPEHLGLAGLDGNAQHLAPPVGVDRHSHYGCHADDPSRTPHLDAGGVQPDTGPFALQWPVEEGVNAFVHLDAQAGDLAFGNASHAPSCLMDVVAPVRDWSHCLARHL